MIDLNTTRVELSDHVLLRPVEETGVMLDLDTERYIGLDETALRMVQTAADSSSIGETVSKLVEIYDADRETIEGDLLGLVIDLDDRGLVKLVPIDAAE